MTRKMGADRVGRRRERGGIKRDKDGEREQEGKRNDAKRD